MLHQTVIIVNGRALPVDNNNKVSANDVLDAVPMSKVETRPVFRGLSDLDATSAPIPLAHLEDAVRYLAHAGNKIVAIRLIRSYAGRDKKDEYIIDIKDAKEVVDRIANE